MFWLIDWSASFAGPTAAKILQYVSFIEHLEDFQRGVIDSRDVVFYLELYLFLPISDHAGYRVAALEAVR